MTGKNYFFSMLFFAIALLGSLLAPTTATAQAICTSTTIINFLPVTGPQGTVVTINGAGFSLGTGTTSVQFNGISAAFTAVSDTQLKATVPAGNTTGTITVITNGCRSVRSGFTLLTTSCTPQDIYISELYDRDGGSYGIIELYNPSATTPVVMNGQYVLQRYGNIGDPSPSSDYILTLSGTINPQDTYIVSSYGSGENGCPTLHIDENMGNGINGNDQIKLLRDGRVIDVANAPNEVGYSVVRKPNVTAPKVAQSNSDWDFYSDERCDNLGWHDPGNAVPSTPPVFTAQPVNVALCEGQSTATFSVTLSSTTGATYQWKTVNASGAWVNVSGAGFSGATTRTLTVTATAALNNTQYYCVVTTPTCTLISNVALLTVSSAPQATYVAVNASCATNTGTITMTPVSGNGLTYSLDGGAYQAGTLFTGVAVGPHTVTVKNAEGCTATISNIVITAPVLPTLATATLIQPDCTNANGTITVTAPLSADFEYSIDGTTFQSGLVFNVSTAGSYTITVRNTITGCTSVSLPFVINAVPNAPAQATATLIQPDCTNANGTITVTAPLSADYEYSIDGTTFQSGLVFNVSTAGSYTITVRNTITGCTSVSLPFVINAVPNAPTQATATLVQPDCTNANGTITVTAPLSADFEYSIDGTTFQSGLVFNVSTAGSYTITVRNTITGCTSVSLPFVINAVPNAPAQATATLVQPDCTNANGTITVTAPLSADFEYSIDGTTFQSGLVFNVSTAGSYTITVRNTITGCTSVSLPFVINAVPNAPAQATATLIQPDCTNANGTITVTAPLSADFEYSIDGTTFQSGLVFNVSTAGSYTITVRNTVTGCTSVSLPFVINAVPNAPAQATATLIQPDCTNANGTITVTAPLSADYEYSIDGTTFQSGLVFNASTAGSYTITVRNTITGCTSVSLPFVINAVPNAPAQATATLVQPDCTNANGTITVTAPLSADFEYSIDGTTFQSGLVFNTSTAGSYTITVRNTITGCTSVSLPFVINAPLSGLPQLTGTQGCTPGINGSSYILEGLALNNSFNVADVTFAWRIAGQTAVIGNDATFNVTEYKNNNGLTNQDFPLQFELTVITNGGCTDTYTFTVESIVCDIPKGISPNNDTLNDSFDLSGMNVSRLTIVNRYGLEVYHRNNYRNEWHGQTDNGQDLPTGTYFYMVQLPDGTRTGWVYVNREAK